MVSTSFMVDTSSHPRAQLHRCVERSAYGNPPARICEGESQMAELLDRASLALQSAVLPNAYLIDSCLRSWWHWKGRICSPPGIVEACF
ncbi:hypothetical protein ACVI1J_005371 [Bradyrhizobium diazoefficiens]